ncbi:hypothetical protein J3B02_005108 [Coemansia erecta]|uniref:Elongation of fatty acids protein n=1 Tax=Coemansia asiatica TaxID=1052880 RepID=A0A9W7XMI5_9FUNG|nr:hypothetical protein LPJ64_000786 [Coemansia asiatica]KAJ2843955.1 hypothetical protein J3B02_005108 [Coemansia erecta]KAJ2881961.1 hypothetical protein FB639_002497 [Coemansia asiatica]
MDLRIEPAQGLHVSLSSVPLGDWYPVFMQWQVPVTVSVIYMALSFYMNSSLASRPAAKKSNGPSTKKTIFEPMTMLTFVHNVVLAIYSGWTFVCVFPPFVQGIRSKGWFEGLCDTDGSLLNSVLFVHNYLFYLSKYYELIDTLIIVLKGRKASFLQIYHHAGVILIMYYANYTSSPTSIFIVWENSGVHTIMYTYYALTAVGIHPPGKQYLTSLQIFQFLFGLSFIVLYMFLPGCQSPAQRSWLWAMTAYLLPLIYLFVQFFASTYSKKKTVRVEKKTE